MNSHADRPDLFQLSNATCMGFGLCRGVELPWRIEHFEPAAPFAAWQGSGMALSTTELALEPARSGRWRSIRDIIDQLSRENYAAHKQDLTNDLSGDSWTRR